MFCILFRYNVVPTHAAFILICLYSQARNIQRHHTVRRRKPKKTKKNKIQNLSEGPKTFGLFGVPSVFWFRLNETIAFLDFWWKTTKTRVFWFFGWVSSEKHKTNLVFFWDSVGKPKIPLGTPQKSKSSGPSHRLLNFWFFGGNQKTQNPKPF